MKNSSSKLVIFLILFLTIPLFSEFSDATPLQDLDYWPTEEWQTSTLKAQGMRSKPLQGMESMLESADWRFLVDSILIVKNGYIVYEHYRSESQLTTPHQVFSCTKVLTSTLIGICVDEGNITSLDNPAVDYFTDYSFDSYTEKQTITVRHLLTMTSGLEWVDNNDYYSMESSSNPVEYVLNKTLSSDPGHEWNYNSGGSHVLSAIVQNASEVGTAQLAEDRIFRPLGIDDYTWNTIGGIPNGGTLLYLKSRNMAKIGLLYLHGGTWNGTQIITEEWIETATSHLIDIQEYWYSGYGYQWWRLNYANCFGARGSNTQTIFVFPELDMVVVSTGGGEFPFEWMVQEYILPATETNPFIPWVIGGSIGVGVVGIGLGVFYIIRYKKVKRSA